jgi:hypothetical protein
MFGAGGEEAARVSWGVVQDVTSADLDGGRMERMIMGRVQLGEGARSL